jgi:hypothetical protein
MGWLATELGYDPAHEGYAAGKLPNGDLTGPGAQPGEVLGYLPACACGWRGRTEQSPTRAGAEATSHIWRGHIRDVVAEQGRDRESLVALFQRLTIQAGRLQAGADTAEDHQFIRRALAHGAEVAAALWPDEQPHDGQHR